MMIKPPVSCLWFNDNAEEAANFYCSLIQNSKIIERSYYADGSFRKAGSLMTITFKLNGTEYMGINGGDIFKHSPAFSICLTCETQEELDRLWDGFIAHGGIESQCGWLTDKYGVSWQITPQILIDIYTEGGEMAARTARAMYGMKKLIIKDLVAASHL